MCEHFYYKYYRPFIDFKGRGPGINSSQSKNVVMLGKEDLRSSEYYKTNSNLKFWNFNQSALELNVVKLKP